MAQQMHRCGDRLPADQSELEHVGLRTRPSLRVAPPCIAEAPVAFECTLWETLQTESRQTFIGRVLMLHARDGLVDTQTKRVRLPDYHPVARFGASFYIRARERFAMGEGRASPSTTMPIDEV